MSSLQNLYSGYHQYWTGIYILRCSISVKNVRILLSLKIFCKHFWIDLHDVWKCRNPLCRFFLWTVWNSVFILMSFRLSFRSLILGCSTKCLKMCHFHFFELSETVSLFSDKLFEFEFEFSSDTGLELLYKNVWNDVIFTARILGVAAYLGV